MGWSTTIISHCQKWMKEKCVANLKERTKAENNNQLKGTEGVLSWFRSKTTKREIWKGYDWSEST